MTIDLNAITRTRIPAKKIINQYKEGRRDFRNLDLRNYSFKKQDLRDADFSGSDIRGCSFEGATLENTNFSSVITGFSQSYWFNLFVSAVFGFLIWNYCLTFTAKYIEMITNPFKVAVEGILGIYVAEIFTIIAQAPLFFTVIIIILLIIAVPSFICDKKYLTNYVSSSTNSSLISGLFPSLLLSIIFIVTSILIEDLLHLRFDLIRFIALLFILAIDSIVLYRVLRTLFVNKTDGTTFKNTNLNRAKFDQSSLKNCSFEGSSLDHASFSHAVLRKCSFTDANISYVNWRYSQFILPNYFTSHCDLLEKKIRTLCTTGNGNRGDYQNADLKQVDLSGIDLTGADLSGADLSNANLQNALLEGANLSNCKAGGTDFTGAIINNSTNFENFQINESTKFSDGFPQSILNEFITFEEKPDELNFAYHNLQNLSFKDQNLTGADFTGADIRGCSFEGAILENANFSLVKAGRSNQQFFYAILCIVALIISIGNIYLFGTEYVNLHLGEYLKQHTGMMRVTLLGISYLLIVTIVIISAFFMNFMNLVVFFLVMETMVIDKRIDSIKKSSNIYIQSIAREYNKDAIGSLIPFWLVLMTLTGIESMRRFASVSTNGVIININSIFFLVLLGSFIFFLYRVVILAFLAPVGYSGTSFNKANLNHAIFNQANLKGCNFTHANLDNCNFERAIFIRSRFENTNLAYTNWEAAKFKGKLNHFSGYLINDRVRRLLITRNGRDSNFQEAYFEQVDLRNVDLSGSNLNKANFQNALLEGANLANAQALGTDFTGVIIKDTNFENLRIDSKTKFPDDFAEDILDKCSIVECKLFRNFNFSGRNLQNLSFKDLDLTGANFSGADIRGCSFEGAILENANFSSVIAGRSRKQFLLLTLYIVITIILSGSLELLAIDYVNSHFSVFLRQFTGMMAVPFLWLTHLVVGLIVIAVAAGINLLIIFLLWRPKQNQSKSLEILNLTHFEYIKTVQVYDDFPNIGLCSGIMTISAIGSLFLLINSYSYTTVNTINIGSSVCLMQRTGL
jgi:uncharacterized protein YjbI with pentapeptide repeats